MSAAKQLVALALAVTTLGAAAIEPPPASAPQDGERASPAPVPQPPGDEMPAPAETAPPAAEDETLPPLPAGTVPVGPPPQRFNPTEKVRADFPVSFPIDI